MSKRINVDFWDVIDTHGRFFDLLTVLQSARASSVRDRMKPRGTTHTDYLVEPSCQGTHASGTAARIRNSDWPERVNLRTGELGPLGLAHDESIAEEMNFFYDRQLQTLATQRLRYFRVSMLVDLLGDITRQTFDVQPKLRQDAWATREFFSDMNTAAGNPDGLDFGDFSIVGNYYTDSGGPAYAVTIHHIHFQEDSGPLDISHFISNRTKSRVDTPGKVIEAVEKLVLALNELNPSNTEACDEYRKMANLQVSKGLGYLKRLAIQHHLELMLDGGIQL
jgi:hypothetical protein